MAATIGVKPGNITVPVNNFIATTKQVDLTSVGTITYSGTGWSTVSGSALAIAYADSSGNWWCKGKLAFSTADANKTTGLNITVSAITSKNTSSAVQTFSAHVADAGVNNYAVSGAYINPNSSVFVVESATAFDTGNIFFEILLNAKPTWADANMENVASISAYIPFGQTGAPGEIINGSSISDDSSFQTGGVTSPVKYSTMELTKGTWLIHAQIFTEILGSGSPPFYYTGGIWSADTTNFTDVIPRGHFGFSVEYTNNANGTPRTVNTIAPVTITSNQTYYLKFGGSGFKVRNHSTNDWWQGHSFFYAVRLAG